MDDTRLLVSGVVCHRLSLLDLRHLPLTVPLCASPCSPLFVTWTKAPARPGAGPFSLRGRRGAWRLRGCIGTLAPRALHSALPEYALTAALRDRRFAPVAPGEVPLLRCTVSLLHNFDRAANWRDWQVC